jgi:type I restriction enzyme, S subunit
MSECFTSTQLAGLADITMGQSPGSDRYNKEEHGLPFLQGCAEFGPRYPAPKIYCHPPLRIAKQGSILISVRAPVGTMNVADQNYCIGRGLGAIQGVSGVSDTSFLQYAIEQNTGFLHRRSQGSTFLAIGSDDLRCLPLPKLNIKIQERIAEVLATVDGAIEKTQSLIVKYQQIRVGLMHDLFTRGLTADGKLRPPREKAPELYRETTIGWIPKEWDVNSLRGLVGAGNIINGPFGSDLLTSELKTDGVPVFYVQDIKAGYFKRVSNAHVTELKAAELAFCNVRRDDVLVAKVGAPPCDSCVYPFEEKAIVTQDVIRIRPTPNVDPAYISSLLNSPFGRNAIKKIAIEGTRERVSLTEFKNLVFPIADAQEQTRIRLQFAIAQILIEKEISSRGKLHQQKLGLMHDLLTGKVRVKVDTAVKQATDG